MTESNLPTTTAHPAPLKAALDRFDEWCRAQLAEAEARERITQPLYQYTDAKGLTGIFDSNEMWFTDFRHLNDPSEVFHGVEKAQQVLRTAQRRADPRVKWFLKGAAGMFTPTNLETLGFFVASFSRARNDLSQWRLYADNGRGFAIGFTPTMFVANSSTLNPAPEDNPFVGPVVYKPRDVLRRHRLAIQQAATVFLNAAQESAALLSERSVRIPFMQDLARYLFADQLIWIALTSKHPAYEHEREVRMLIMGSADYLRPAIKTRVRGSEIVPYIAHRWPVCEPGMVVEVMVGPAAGAEAEQSVRALLASKGLFDVKVERSKIPYRAL